MTMLATVRRVLSVTFLAWVVLAAHAFGQDDAARRRLDRLMDAVWQQQLKASPLFATRVGVHEYDDRLGDVSLEAQARRAATARRRLKELEAIPCDESDLEFLIDWKITHHVLRSQVDGFELQAHLMPLTNRWGFHIAFPELPDQVPLKTVRDYENYLARLRAFPGYTRQHIALLREAIRRGYTLPAAVLKGYDKTISAHIVDAAEQSLLYKPFQHFPAAIPPERQKQLRQAGRQAVMECVVPAYREFLKFYQKEYLPAARPTIGARDLPHGDAYYRYAVRIYTTLNLSPQEIHEIGLAEVGRIRKEMAAVRAKTGFSGDHKAFIKFLRKDPRFYAKTPEQLLQHVAWILKRMDGQLPTLFRKLPRTPYGLRPIPDYIAPKTTSAYYSQPAGDGSRAGFYYLNTYDLKSRPLYEMEALSLHEAVPGHHLQLALAQEMENVHPLRRFTEFNAFVEGWALYSERLGLEVGFYRDPYSDFGRLSFEMWRACRLVVDTGIHALGWSRQKAIDFMKEHTALSEHNIEAEVDRYISWPGQALGYKLGELRITALRRRAEQALGEKFDLRRFHEVILQHGSVPLDLLDTIVEREMLR